MVFTVFRTLRPLAFMPSANREQSQNILRFMLVKTSPGKPPISEMPIGIAKRYLSI